MAGKSARATLETHAATVWSYLNRDDGSPGFVDVIFIMGGSSEAPIERAFELWLDHEGRKPKIAFISTGGTFGGQVVFGKPEHEHYAACLIELGVSGEDLAYEGLTTNTKMEVQEAIPFLARSGVPYSRIAVVSRPFHQERAMRTWAAQQPGVVCVSCPADEPLDPYDNKQLLRLVQECARIKTYGDKGDIDNTPIPQNVLTSVEYLKNYLEEAGIDVSR